MCSIFSVCQFNIILSHQVVIDVCQEHDQHHPYAIIRKGRSQHSLLPVTHDLNLVRMNEIKWSFGRSQQGVIVWPNFTHKRVTANDRQKRKKKM